MFGKTRCLWGRGAVTTRRLLAGSDRPGVIFVRRLGLERVQYPPVIKHGSG